MGGSNRNRFFSKDFMIIGIDKEGNVTAFNNKSEKLTGYRKAEVLHKKIWDTILPIEYKEQWMNHSKKVFSQKPTEVFEAPILTKTGKKISALWKLMPIATGTVRDICTLGIEKTKGKKLIRFTKKLEKHKPSKQLMEKPKTEGLLDNDRILAMFAELRDSLIMERELIDGQWIKLREYADLLDELNKTLFEEKNRLIKDEVELKNKKERFNQIFQREIEKFNLEIKEKKQLLEKLQDKEKTFEKLQQKVEDIEELRNSLEKLSEELDKREQKINEKELKIKQEKRLLDKINIELKKKRHDLKEREVNLLKKEEALSKTRRELDEKERELTNLRIKLDRERQELEQRLKQPVNSKDKSYVKKEILRWKQRVEKLRKREHELKEQLRKTRVNERQLKKKLLQNMDGLKRLEELERMLNEEKTARERLHKELEMKDQIIRRFEEREKESLYKTQELERKEKLVEEYEKDLIAREEYLNELAAKLSKEKEEIESRIFTPQSSRGEQPIEPHISAEPIDKPVYNTTPTPSINESTIHEGAETTFNVDALLEEDTPAVVVKKGAIQEATPAFLSMVGYERSELTNKNFFSLISAEELMTVKQYYLDRLKGRELSGYETVILTKDEQLIPVKVRLNPIVWNGETADLIFIEKKG